ncbi:hypothetical protein TCAL_12207 [Tigriopus californicus]|uniref:Uncharacterized protein n=1 Tax=Tigriopus californicus TaxID=6832 RepID=A0A553PT28_TIGCA|nr:uncharacterized protein LOC131891787 [Tigriopus californicus]TRY80825.1 hypothetical protein TCAL_12207 [Tigriopus californicus]
MLKACQLVLLAVLMAGLVSGRKLENWHDPEVQGSILPSAEADAQRQPKFFLGTTTTVTTTESLATTCFTTPAAAVTTTCTGRKKRAISEEPISEDDTTPIITPSAPIPDQRQSKALSLNELASVREGRQDVEPRFAIFYLYTTTTTSTATTFTATTSITLTGCTPATISFARCV